MKHILTVLFLCLLFACKEKKNRHLNNTVPKEDTLVKTKKASVLKKKEAVLVKPKVFSLKDSTTFLYLWADSIFKKDSVRDKVTDIVWVEKPLNAYADSLSDRTVTEKVLLRPDTTLGANTYFLRFEEYETAGDSVAYVYATLYLSDKTYSVEETVRKGFNEYETPFYLTDTAVLRKFFKALKKE